MKFHTVFYEVGELSERLIILMGDWGSLKKNVAIFVFFIPNFMLNFEVDFQPSKTKKLNYFSNHKPF